MYRASLRRAARDFQIPEPTLRYWVREGVLPIRRDDDTLELLLMPREVLGLRVVAEFAKSGIRGQWIALAWAAVHRAFKLAGEVGEGARAYLLVDTEVGYFSPFGAASPPRFVGKVGVLDLSAREESIAREIGQQIEAKEAIRG